MHPRVHQPTGGNHKVAPGFRFHPAHCSETLPTGFRARQAFGIPGRGTPAPAGRSSIDVARDRAPIAASPGIGSGNTGMSLHRDSSPIWIKAQSARLFRDPDRLATPEPSQRHGHGTRSFGVKNPYLHGARNSVVNPRKQYLFFAKNPAKLLGFSTRKAQSNYRFSVFYPYNYQFFIGDGDRSKTP